MPLYDYECPRCGRKKEELIKSGEEKNFYCEECKVKMYRKFPDSVSFRMTDNFKMGRDKPPEKEIARKLEDFKEHPEKDPYRKFREVD